MIIDLNELNYKKEIKLNIKITRDDNLDSRIVDLKDALLNGIIYKSNSGIWVDLQFYGLMIINDSITLEEVEYPFNIKINDNLESLKQEFEQTIDFNKNTLDILLLLWENIVLEVPISYTIHPNAKMAGNGWELKDNNKTDSIDPRLEKLKELLKGDD